MIKTIDVSKGETSKLYKYLTSSVTPRPIALVSTVDKNGHRNLAPFSFFNVFSIDPPILIFSPVRRVRDNTTKDTLKNVKQTKECVIALVTKEIDQQVSLASSDFDNKVNEFEKAGFTELKSDSISPPRIAESPINFECIVHEIIDLGSQGGSGSLVLAKIVKAHINSNILDEKNEIDPFKLNIVSRYGGSWYGKVSQNSLYKIPKPISKIGMGIDKLPSKIKNSKILTGNELAILGSYETIPKQVKSLAKSKFNNLSKQHKFAKDLIIAGKSEEAWQILLIDV